MDSLQPGQMLGPYRLIEQIGQGGMATVYKAYHAAMDRYVALKVLPRQLADNPEFLGRFQQEARIIANLEHPHILPVHDYGESGNITYLVMRLLETGTLKDKMRAGPLSLPEIDRWFGQLADALEYAHARGVVHRDLKPSNVLVDARGNLFLTDFGIAKLLESSSQFTGTGALIGTPDYMSPEQAQGLKVDQRSDIYSLGIILYEMVTGRVPFEAETPLAVILKHLHDPLPLPSSLKPDLPPAIERVLLKALAKPPEDRFATTHDFHEAWKKALAETTTMQPEKVLPPAAAPQRPGVTVAGRPPSSISRPAVSGPGAKAPRRALPIVVVIAGVGLVLALCGGLAIILGIGRLATILPTTTPRSTPAPAVATGASPAPKSSVLPTAGSSVSPTAGSAVPPAPGAATEPTPAPTMTGQWTSWVKSNTPWAIAVWGDKVYAGGDGGVTVWNRVDGTLLTRYTTDNGLPGPWVSAMVIDEQTNTLWVGTDSGLARYDGKGWRVYGYDAGLDSNTVMALTLTKSGLLIGTHYSDVDGGGLELLTGDTIHPVPNFPSANPDQQPDKLANSVSAIAEDGAGRLWVGTRNGLGLLDDQGWKRFSTSDGLPDNDITRLYLDRQGVLWVGTSAGPARYANQKFETFTTQQPELNNAVYGILEDAEGGIWFSGSGGAARFDPAAQTWRLFSETNGVPANTLHGIGIDAEGILYFGSDGAGVVRYVAEQFESWTVPNMPFQVSFDKILVAPDGQLWFVENQNWWGSRFDPGTTTWTEFADLPAEDCRPQAFDAAGGLWCGNYDGLWHVTADGKQTHFTTRQGLPSDHVTAVRFAPEGAAWIGTEEGLARLEGTTVTAVFNAENAGFTENFVNTLLVAADSSLWVSTNQGLSHYRADQWEHYTIGQPFTDNLSMIMALTEDPAGTLWVGTVGDGLFRLAEGTWTQFLPHDPGVELPSSTINGLATDAQGRLWIGTEDGGAIYDGQTWTAFGTADRLISPHVRDVLAAPGGAVWFATNGGVTRYNP